MRASSGSPAGTVSSAMFMSRSGRWRAAPASSSTTAVVGRLGAAHLHRLGGGWDSRLSASRALGFPVVDVAAALFDGSSHAVDSSDMAFKTAARMAMQEAMPKCSPVLLEPIFAVEVSAPNEFTARVHSPDHRPPRPDPEISAPKRAGPAGTWSRACCRNPSSTTDDHRTAVADAAASATSPIASIISRS